MLNISFKAAYLHWRYLVLFFCMLPTFSFAQQFSAEQIATFRQLPPAQQQALAKQFGIDPAIINTLTQTSSNTSTAQVLEQPTLIRPLGSTQAPPTQDNINNINSVEGVLDSESDDILSNQDNITAFSQRLDSISNFTEVNITDLQRSRNEVTDLSAFGYDVFAGAPTTFAPATDVPIPVEYKLGPGDTINILLSGKINRTLNLTINRAGMINAPEIGVLTLSGLTFSAATQLIVDTISQKNIGLSVHVTLGELRSVRIFILGEANRPGSYTVSALSTLTNALFVSGGIKPSGSLRKIQLKRAGQVITEFDLYELLVHGNNQNDTRIMAGDVIFIPPVGNTISVAGEVNRDAIFELKHEKTIADIEVLFGGYKPTAFLKKTKIERIDGLGARTVKDIDVSHSDGKSHLLRNGDIIKIPSVLDESNNIITLAGHVYRPGDYAFQAGMKLNDIVSDASHLLGNIDLDYALIKEESKFDKSVVFKQFSVRELLLGKPIEITANATVYFFAATEDRSLILEESLTQLAYQGNLSNKSQTISVNGAVKFPGVYPFVAHMTVEQALNAAGSLEVDATKQFAILLAYNDQEEYTPTLLNLEKSDDLATTLDAAGALYFFTKTGDRIEELRPIMDLLQTSASKATGDSVITIEGEVKFPGVYPYTMGLTINELITAAGGLKTSAYLGETEISRFVFNNNLGFDRNIVPINLAAELDSKTNVLQPKDVVLIKRIPDWEDEEYVELIGEFKFPGRYLIQKGETLAQIIARAGGLTKMAYPGATVFFRESVAEQQRIEIARLNALLDKQLEIAVAKNNLSGLNAGFQSSANLNRVADVIAETSDDGLGRISIDLSAQLLGMDTPLEVFANDRVVVPRKPSTIQVIGEVNRATSHVYNENLSLDDYIELAGGGTQFANTGDIYIIRADGRIVIPGGDWFSYTQADIKPGDTIVVPFDVALRDNLSLWQQVTRIIYNSAVSLSAIRGL